ncbi:hypothetical protein GL263_17410 [Streptomyces durbertensis]|uniref:Uncharacterized protein n=1 Tax=Streptomyces durbertensis TaxID=2448886 RepID=A0ABR6EJ91_9ACTN|nr:hypothetical protein [Streptomyces durbertensis]MBB1245333.1 hypothetical protein [Streptomyces durbertensis]
MSRTDTPNAGVPRGTRAARRHSPLRRRVDRVETRARTLLAVLLVAGGGWAAAASGTAAYEAQHDIVRTQTAERAPFTATLTGDANGTTGRLGDNAHRARVVWDDTDGNERAGVAHVRADARAGETVDIWVGPDGRVTDRPAPATSAPLAGAVAGGAAAGAATAAALAAAYALRRTCDRHRDHLWETEWAAVEPKWSHRQTN